jgi:hypothetical protein
MTWEGITFHHYKSNFNAAGILEMICSRIERLDERDPDSGDASFLAGNRLGQSVRMFLSRAGASQAKCYVRSGYD